MENKPNLYKKRAKIMALAIIFLFILLLSRLYYLQIHKSDELSSGALNQRGKEIFISSRRGTIFDINNLPLTNDEKIPNLVIQKQGLLDDRDLYNQVLEMTKLSSYEFKEQLSSDESLLVLPMDQGFDLENNNKKLFLIDIVNRYNEDNLLSHVIGYINKSDNRGESGIEKLFDEFLNIDKMDSFIVEYDKSRTLILDGSYKVNQNTNPYNPSGVKLTIDKSIQGLVEKTMDKHSLNGAVIVADVDTSDILALASRPNFNQNEIQSYFHDDSMALYNKAIQVGYPPGSIFKIVVVLTALEGDSSIIEEEYFCKGYEEINGVRINCGGKHGRITLEEAFAKSCNSVFIQLALDVGSDNIIDMARSLGFGQRINIGLMEETEGNLPTANELLGAAVGNIAIGQGKIEVTPLQITNMMMTLVNDGVSKPLKLIKGITNDTGYILKKYNVQDEKRLISQESSEKLIQMMREVVKSGTGRYIELEDIGGCGGKTGSAEGILKQEKTIHGWFSGYYPYKNPKYLVTVLIEDADSGSRTAAPIFEEIIRAIYQLFPRHSE